MLTSYNNNQQFAYDSALSLHVPPKFLCVVKREQAIAENKKKKKKTTYVCISALATLVLLLIC